MKRKKKNIILEKVLVNDYAAEGKSLARVDGKIIFIEGAVPGDVVDVQLLKSKKDWAEGRPLRFHSYSAEREKPFCSHFGIVFHLSWNTARHHFTLYHQAECVWSHCGRHAEDSHRQ